MAAARVALALAVCAADVAGKTTDCDVGRPAIGICESTGAKCLDKDRKSNNQNWICLCDEDSNGSNRGVLGPTPAKCANFMAMCMVATDCNDNALAVTRDPVSGDCTCDCKPAFYGPACASECTIAADCNDNADSVAVDSTGMGCECTCSSGWAGAGCSTCATDYYGPMCASQCTNGGSCSGNADAVAVNSTGTGCDCTCAAGWHGPTCSDSKCTVAGDCNSNADSVVAGSNGMGCVCTCSSGWAGAGCSTCAPDYYGPMCTSQCTNGGSCSGNADVVAVNSTGTGCDCTCAAGWHGPTCSDSKCTVAGDCNSNADSVVAGSNGMGCVCTCSQGFEGPTCADRIDSAFGCPDLRLRDSEGRDALVPVTGTDTVRYVKEQFSAGNGRGVPASMLVLYHEGAALGNDTVLNAVKVAPACVLHYYYSNGTASFELLLFLKTTQDDTLGVAGGTIPLFANYSDTVGELRGRVVDVVGMPEPLQVLRYVGVELADGAETLREYNLRNGDTLELTKKEDESAALDAWLALLLVLVLFCLLVSAFVVYMWRRQKARKQVLLSHDLTMDPGTGRGVEESVAMLEVDHSSPDLLSAHLLPSGVMDAELEYNPAGKRGSSTFSLGSSAVPAHHGDNPSQNLPSSSSFSRAFTGGLSASRSFAPLSPAAASKKSGDLEAWAASKYPNAKPLVAPRNVGNGLHLGSSPKKAAKVDRQYMM
eukprot:TRINITY_DN5987_c0_g1_i1.p1 TRINITY_DN5987_c0_g1~~TRINITY_DN5987_c0_g1_i1.p1  ORF type:complete len:708 (+),score=69.92 TRINITY_DN5987_c0_g1_i1:44-2167(+)